MGRQVISAASRDSDVRLTGALVRPGSTLAGQDAGTIAGIGALGLPLVDDPNVALDQATVAVDVSVPAASVGFARVASERGVPVVVATTGLSAEQRESIES